MSPRTSIHLRIAATGQRGESVRPTTISILLQTGRIWTLSGEIESSWDWRGYLLPSPHAKLVAGLNCVDDSCSSSPRRKNPKNADAETAQRTPLSGLVDVASECCIASKMRTVIGRRMRVGVPLRALVRLIPAWTLLRIGSEDWSLGSGRPSEICILRSAER